MAEAGRDTCLREAALQGRLKGVGGRESCDGGAGVREGRWERRLLARLGWHLSWLAHQPLGSKDWKVSDSMLRALSLQLAPS